MNKGVEWEIVKVSLECTESLITSLLRSKICGSPHPSGYRQSSYDDICTRYGLHSGPFASPTPSSASLSLTPSGQTDLFPNLDLAWQAPDSLLLGGSKFCPRHLSEVSHDHPIFSCGLPLHHPSTHRSLFFFPALFYPIAYLTSNILFVDCPASFTVLLR